MNVNRLNIIRHTRNYDAMLAFYRRQLGMTTVTSWEDDRSRGTVLAFEGAGDGVTIEILDLDDLAVPGVNRPVNLDLGVHVDDVQGWQKTLVARGVTIARQMVDDPWGSRSFGIDDPDGWRIWFIEWEDDSADSSPST